MVRALRGRTTLPTDSEAGRVDLKAGHWSLSTPNITDRPSVLVAVCRLIQNAQPDHGKGTHQLKSCGDACWGTIVPENPMSYNCSYSGGKRPGHSFTEAEGE